MNCNLLLNKFLHPRRYEFLVRDCFIWCGVVFRENLAGCAHNNTDSDEVGRWLQVDYEQSQENWRIRLDFIRLSAAAHARRLRVLDYSSSNSSFDYGQILTVRELKRCSWRRIEGGPRGRRMKIDTSTEKEKGTPKRGEQKECGLAKKSKSNIKFRQQWRLCYIKNVIKDRIAMHSYTYYSCHLLFVKLWR